MIEETISPARLASPGHARAWPAFFLISLLEALVSFARLAAIPADPKHDLLFGYSLNRLVMLAGVLVVALAAASLAVIAWRAPAWREKWLEPLARARRAFTGAMLLAALLALSSWLTLVLLRLNPQGPLFSAYQRLHPLLVLIFLIALQTLLWLPVMRFGLHADFWGSQKPLLRASLLVFTFLLALFLVIALTGYGITPDLYAWGPPGVPLLAWQVLLAALVGCSLFLLFPVFRTAESPRKKFWLDLALALGIWALAAGLWLSQPIQPSYFNPQVRPPNLEYYPYSDAGYYDYIAQSLVTGSGYLGHRVISRPLYVLFLAALHTLVGNGYSQLITLQTLTLAIFPVLLYLLGRAFHSRAAGVIVALLATLRELNAFAATPLTEVSNSKMLLSDLPAALGVVLLVLLAFLWLQNPGRRWLPLLVGGALGLLALVRAQSLLFVPFLLMAALFVYRGRLLRWLQAAVLVAAGLALVIFPWMARNAIIGSGFVIDQPGNQVIILAQRYSTQLQRWPDRQPGESDAAYSSRMLRIAREFALANPLYTAGFVGAHFLNNEIDTLAVLPVHFQFDDARDMWFVSSLFWENLFSGLDAREVALLLLNLLLVAIGVAVSWRKWRVAGFLPLILNLAYSLSNAVARNSGWRYILPVDWTGYFYFAIGGLQVFSWLLALLGRYRVPVNPKALNELLTTGSWQRGISFGLLFLGLGLAVPLAEFAYPVRYPAQTPQQIAGQMASNPAVLQTGVTKEALQAFPGGENAVLLRGRALYPRFYFSWQGEPGSSWAAYKPREGSRLAFMVVDGTGSHMVLLRQGKPPAYFPNAADVSVLGCQTKDGLVEAALVVVSATRERAYLRALTGPLACPLE